MDDNDDATAAICLEIPLLQMAFMLQWPSHGWHKLLLGSVALPSRMINEGAVTIRLSCQPLIPAI